MRKRVDGKPGILRVVRRSDRGDWRNCRSERRFYDCRTGIFLVIDPYKNNSFIRFHAYQSIFFNVAWIGLWIAWMIVGLVLGAVTKGLFFLIEMPINLALMVGGFCLWAFLMYSAYQTKTFRLPVIGALAARQAGL
jgi:uncharacterized membrane protein